MYSLFNGCKLIHALGLIVFFALTPGYVHASKIYSTTILNTDTLTEVDKSQNLDLETPTDSTLADSLNATLAVKKKESNFARERKKLFA